MRTKGRGCISVVGSKRWDPLARRDSRVFPKIWNTWEPLFELPSSLSSLVKSQSLSRPSPLLSLPQAPVPVCSLCSGFFSPKTPNGRECHPCSVVSTARFSVGLGSALLPAIRWAGYWLVHSFSLLLMSDQILFTFWINWHVCNCCAFIHIRLLLLSRVSLTFFLL